MIQEIYDYLFIRAFIGHDTDVLIEACKDKEKFKYFMHNIAKIMEEEDYFIISEQAQENILEILYAYRFEYNHDKELNDKMNYIITKINSYKEMPADDKKKIAEKWLSNEYKDRELPFAYQDICVVLDNILKEDSLFMKINGYEINGNEYIPTGVDHIDANISPIEYLQLLNLIANRYPAFYFEDGMIEIALNNLDELLRYKHKLITYLYILKTKCVIKSLDKDVKKLKKELGRLSY